MAATYRAYVCTGIGRAEIQDLLIPSAREGQILVRTRAVALNPTDWKTIANSEGFGVNTKIGCDFAGVVEAVGPDVTKFAKGDRICGFAFGGKDLEQGAFGEYVLTQADPAIIKIPENLSFEEAATLGVGITTVGQGLYQCLQLPMPEKPATEPTPVFINGGSTTTGILGIQFAKLSGLTVYTTASPRNFDYLRSLGADHVYDYHADAATLGAQIRADSGNALAYAWDCSPTAESATLSALALSDRLEGRYASLLGYDEKLIRSLNPSVRYVAMTLGYTVFGQTFRRFGRTWEASRDGVEFGRGFWAHAGGLLARAKVQVARMEVNRGGEGLGGVEKGLEDLKAGKVSAVKLVYTF